MTELHNTNEKRTGPHLQFLIQGKLHRDVQNTQQAGHEAAVEGPDAFRAPDRERSIQRVAVPDLSLLLSLKKNICGSLRFKKRQNDAP